MQDCAYCLKNKAALNKLQVQYDQLMVDLSIMKNRQKISQPEINYQNKSRENSMNNEIYNRTHYEKLISQKNQQIANLISDCTAKSKHIQALNNQMKQMFLNRQYLQQELRRVHQYISKQNEQKQRQKQTKNVSLNIRNTQHSYSIQQQSNGIHQQSQGLENDDLKQKCNFLLRRTIILQQTNTNLMKQLQQVLKIDKIKIQNSKYNFTELKKVPINKQCLEKSSKNNINENTMKKQQWEYLQYKMMVLNTQNTKLRENLSNIAKVKESCLKSPIHHRAK